MIYFVKQLYSITSLLESTVLPEAAILEKRPHWGACNKNHAVRSGAPYAVDGCTEFLPLSLDPAAQEQLTCAACGKLPVMAFSTTIIPLSSHFSFTWALIEEIEGAPEDLTCAACSELP
jgi:ZF-HD homeobox protein with Cys/His-rich dimerization domain